MRNRARITPEAIKTNTILGNNLRYIRNRRKLTLQKLATLAGVRYQQIGKYEHGVDQMSAYRLLQLSQLLKVKIKYIPMMIKIIVRIFFTFTYFSTLVFFFLKKLKYPLLHPLPSYL